MIRTALAALCVLLVSGVSYEEWSLSTAGGAAFAQQTEQIQGESPNPMVKEPGAMETSEVLALLDRIRLTEYRVNDLLTDVHPERWKMPEVMRASVGKSATELRAQMNEMDAWRAEMAKRPNSAYLAFETYEGLNALSGRLDALARLVSQNETASFGAQYAASGDRFLSAQQTLGLYLGYLLRNQDQVASAMEGNLSTCQRELGEAMRGRALRATPIPNARPIRPARRARQSELGASKSAASNAESKKETQLKPKTSEPKP